MRRVRRVASLRPHEEADAATSPPHDAPHGAAAAEDALCLCKAKGARWAVAHRALCATYLFEYGQVSMFKYAIVGFVTVRRQPRGNETAKGGVK